MRHHTQQDSTTVVFQQFFTFLKAERAERLKDEFFAAHRHNGDVDFAQFEISNISLD